LGRLGPNSPTFGIALQSSCGQRMCRLLFIWSPSNLVSPGCFPLQSWRFVPRTQHVPLSTAIHADVRGRARPYPVQCRRWRSNPSGKCSQDRLTRGTVTSTMRRAAHPSECARCGAGVGCSAIKYQSLYPVQRLLESLVERRCYSSASIGLTDYAKFE